MLGAEVALKQRVVLAHVSLQVGNILEAVVTNCALFALKINKFFIRIVVEKMNAILFLSF